MTQQNIQTNPKQIPKRKGEHNMQTTQTQINKTFLLLPKTLKTIEGKTQTKWLQIAYIKTQTILNHIGQKSILTTFTTKEEWKIINNIIDKDDDNTKPPAVITNIAIDIHKLKTTRKNTHA